MEEKSVDQLNLKKQLEKIIEVKNVKKIYRMGKERIVAVNGVSFEIMKGEFCCLLGTSGSGKSTLLNLMAGIEKTTSGQILIKGKNIPRMKENQLARFRQDYLGFVFQSYNLINTMTALENVEFPLVFKKISAKKRKQAAKKMLTEVGLGKRLRHKPKEMSGGQQQRVGIARAFVGRPEIVFADEPTGNLDTKTTMEVMQIIRKIAKENNQTIVMVTHDPRLAAFADKIIRILDGQIQSIDIITDITDPEQVAAAELALTEAFEAAKQPEEEQLKSSEPMVVQKLNQEASEQMEVKQLTQEESDQIGIQKLNQEISEQMEVNQLTQEESDQMEIKQLNQEASEQPEVKQLNQETSEMVDIDYDTRKYILYGESTLTRDYNPRESKTARDYDYGESTAAREYNRQESTTTGEYFFDESTATREFVYGESSATGEHIFNEGRSTKKYVSGDESEEMREF